MMLSALVLLGDLGVGVLAILLSFIIKGNISKLLQRVGAAVTIGGLLSGTVFYSMSLYNSIFVVGNNYAMQIGLFFVINIVRAAYPNKISRSSFILQHNFCIKFLFFRC